MLSSSHSANCLTQMQRAMLVTILWRELEGAASGPVGSMLVSISHFLSRFKIEIRVDFVVCGAAKNRVSLTH